MENGMADYAHKAATTGTIYLDSIADYDLYCHYVAGLVGEGLTRIWSASGKEAPWLCDQLELANSMGLLLQKTNIIRDFREDVEEKRFFWPREIWAKYGFEEMKDLYEKGDVERATWIQSGMILDALRHACDSLDYLRLLKNQSVFVFCAVPVSMAMATLALCFMNPEMFQRNIKIRKAEAARVRRLVPRYARAYMDIFLAAYHAIDEYERSSPHLPRVRTQDPPQGKTARPELSQNFSHVLQGPSVCTTFPNYFGLPTYSLFLDRAMVRTELPLVRHARPEWTDIR